jgi:hypothetical protein
MGFNVDRDASLVCVEHLPRQASLWAGYVIREWTDASSRVSSRSFDFDDVRSQLGKKLPAVRSVIFGEIQAPVWE